MLKLVKTQMINRTILYLPKTSMAGIRNALKMDVDCSAVGSSLLLLSNNNEQ